MLAFMILCDITSSISQLLVFVLHGSFFLHENFFLFFITSAKKKCGHANTAESAVQEWHIWVWKEAGFFFLPSTPPFYSRSGEECGDHSSETERVSFVPYSLLAGGRGSASLVPMTYCLRVLQLKVTHSHSTSSPPADFLILIPQCCL